MTTYMNVDPVNRRLEIGATWYSHLVGRAGELRDTCVYSIIASEWPAVRQNLTWRLGRTSEAAKP